MQNQRVKLVRDIHRVPIESRVVAEMKVGARVRGTALREVREVDDEDLDSLRRVVDLVKDQPKDPDLSWKKRRVRGIPCGSWKGQLRLCRNERGTHRWKELQSCVRK